MSDSIFLIKEIWFDSMENDISAAVGYKPLGFVYTRQEAESFCAKGRVFTKEDCWAVFEEMNEFKYSEIKRLSIITL